MLYTLIRKMNGKSDTMITDTLKRVKQREKLLKNSYRGKKVSFDIVPAEEDEEKYLKPPHDGSYVGGDRQSPRRIK